MSLQSEAPVLFSGTVVNGETKYVPVPIRNGALGAQIGWLTAAASATITLELSSFPDISPYVAGTAYQWTDSGVAITGPSATAIGSTTVNVENVRQKQARLKIVGAATSPLEIRDGTA